MAVGRYVWTSRSVCVISRVVLTHLDSFSCCLLTHERRMFSKVTLLHSDPASPPVLRFGGFISVQDCLPPPRPPHKYPNRPSAPEIKINATPRQLFRGIPQLLHLQSGLKFARKGFKGAGGGPAITFLWPLLL